jgi:hypothetical protein
MLAIHFGARLPDDDVAMNIRVLGIVLLCLTVASCASRRPLAELEAEALETGDWSAVERYKYIDYKMGRITDDQVCKNGYVLYCDAKGKNVECTCNSPEPPYLRN